MLSRPQKAGPLPMQRRPQRLSGLQKGGRAKGVRSKELGFVDSMIRHLVCDSATDNQA